jgi:hypothetical protein
MNTPKLFTVIVKHVVDGQLREAQEQHIIDVSHFKAIEQVINHHQIKAPYSIFAKIEE